MKACSSRLWSVPLLAILGFVSMAVDAARHPEMESGAPSLAGKLLVASPDLEDPNFRRTVVYVVHHDATGAMGLVINRVIGAGPLDKLLEGFGLEAEPGATAEIKVYSGGPVERERGFMLHSPDYRIEDTVVLSAEVAVTSSLRVLEDLAAGKGPKHSLFAFGYSGWAPRQLDAELAAGAWVVIDPDEALLFDDDVETKWQRAVERRGVDL